MRFPTSCPIHIVMLGAGGTGGFIAPHLYRLLYSLFRPSVFLICDGDRVEKKNLVRQNFAPCDLGRNKAQALAERYASAFGMEAYYRPDFVEDTQTLEALLTPSTADALVILIGAVDNNRSRRLCHAVFHNAKNLIYIDSGNGEQNGQVVCGVRRSGRTVRRPAAGFYKDILMTEDHFPSELSCADAALSSPQSIAANLMAATLVNVIIYNILVKGTLDTRMATFSTRTGNVRPLLSGRKAA